MFHRTLKWYRTLKTGWKAVAWIVVVLVAVCSFAVFALPWLMSSRLRTKVRKLEAEAALGKAKQQIQVARRKVADLEVVRDEALASEQEHAAEEVALDVQLEKVQVALEAAQTKVEGQTNEEQGRFFNSRFSK